MRPDVPHPAGAGASPPTTASTGTASPLAEARVVGVLRAPDHASAVAAALAAARAGLRAIEITLTTPNAEDIVRNLREQLPASVLLGAGTVMNAAQAGAALAAGATFLVSPHLGEDVLEVALAAGVEYLPGVLTPTEIARARRLGATTLKLFPVGSSGGPALLRDLLGPFPDLACMVTGGVRPADVRAYLAAGALAVGLGSSLFPKAALESGDADAVETATRAALREADALP